MISQQELEGLTRYSAAMADQASPMHETRPERIVLNTQLITEHIGNPKTIQWVTAESLLADNAVVCVDGREKKGAVGTPGGNAGEFVLMVQAAENVMNRQLSASEIRDFFLDYVNKFGKFYMHTDEHAFEHLEKALASDARFADSHSSIEVLVENCPPEHQEALLEYLTSPDNMGCGHLKLMIKNAQEYGVRAEVVLEMVRNYYRELWAKNPQMEFGVLGGDHVEGAVVNVTTADEVVEGMTEIPTISPMANGTSFFTNHPQATEFLRTTIAQAVVDQEMLAVTDLAAFQAEIARLGKHYLTTTVTKLAKDDEGNALPVFKVKFTSKTEFTVTQVA